MSKRSDWILGIVFIVIVSFLWTGGSMLTQYIYSDLGFESPFVVTYVSTTLFFLYIPVWRIAKHFNMVKFHPWSKTDSDVDNYSLYESIVQLYIGTNDEHTLGKSSMSHEEVFKISFVLAVIWFVSNCFYSYSLFWTTIASSTIISNLSGSFTLFFCWLVNLEDVTYQKLIGMILCFSGVILISIKDQQDSDDDSEHSSSEAFVGDIMAILSAIGYGGYTCYLRYHIPNEDIVSMQLVLGYMGLICGFVFAPALLVVIYFHIDNLSHFSGVILAILIGQGLFDYVISDYLWARSIVLTTPTVATVGLSITIPMAFGADIILNGYKEIKAFAIIGSVLVVVGFSALNINLSGDNSDDQTGCNEIGDDNNEEEEMNKHLSGDMRTPLIMTHNNLTSTPSGTIEGYVNVKTSGLRSACKEVNVGNKNNYTALVDEDDDEDSMVYL